MRLPMLLVLLCFSITSALCWSHADFVSHVNLRYVSDTFFPPVPSIPLHELPTAWSDHIHFAVRT
jgi:hypothetical protein